MSIGPFAGFGLRGYRSFGDDQIQFVGPIENVHLLVGRNNVGKSNLLRFVVDVLSQLRNDPRHSMSDLYRAELVSPAGWDDSVTRVVSFAVRVDEDVRNRLFGDAWRLVQPLLTTLPFTRGMDGVVWFDFELDAQGAPTVSSAQLRAAFQVTGQGFTEQRLSEISLNLTNQSNDPVSNFQQLVMLWAPWTVIPQVHWVDTYRRITNDPNNSGMGMRNGQGLINALASIQNPDRPTHAADTARWNRLNAFVRGVLDDQSAFVQVPNSEATILVGTADSEPMPLDALGTGIGELIILAAVGTLIDNSLICVEEPELHLHPTLQRMLIQFLHGQTTNQYIIATHSAAMVNADLASTSHLTKPGAWTHVNHVVDSHMLSAAVSDLGNRASDLVQSNFIVWVEGPSDRIYVQHWLSAYDPELIEGAHYSIMFYGGALLSHLTADDEETNDFIKLLRINRNLAMLIDSDKKSARATLNETKRRVIGEIETVGGLAWVTDGYTVENYVPTEALTTAVTELYPRRRYEVAAHKWTSPIGRAFGSSQTRPSKVSVARHVVAQGLPVDTWAIQLESKVLELSRRIRAANDLPVRP